MRRTVIACYRPKEGKREALEVLTRTHVARLYELGLVTRKRPILMRAGDGTLLEVFEWKSQRAIEEAHEDPAVLEMWTEYAAVCDYVPVGTLAEADQLFSGFESLEFEAVMPKLSRVFNHVQVDARIATSGALTAQNVADIAAAGYRRIIDLLPADNPHVLAGERELVTQNDMIYEHIPVDFAAPTEADFDAFVRAMRQGAQHKVWVHCAANYRVTAFMSLYGQHHMGWTPQRAAELIAEVWQPDAVWQRFMEQHSPR